MYGCESWTIKKAECRRIGGFELWCWRRRSRVPWTTRRSNQSILKKISPEYSLEGLMLKLKHQYFVHLMQRTDSLEKTQMLGKIEGRRRGVNRGWDGWMTSLIQWTWVWASSRNWWWIGRPDVLHSMGLQGVGHYWATELNWWEREHYLQIERLTLSLYIGYRLYKDGNLCLFWSLMYLRMATNTMQALSKCLLNKWMIPVLYPCLVGRTTSN